MVITDNTAMQPIKALFCGIQDCEGLMPNFELWTILEPMGDIPAGSTLSINTIRKAGYNVETSK